MDEDDFSYLMEHEPYTVSSLCNSLSIELQELKEKPKDKNYAN